MGLANNNEKTQYAWIIDEESAEIILDDNKWEYYARNIKANNYGAQK